MAEANARDGSASASRIDSARWWVFTTMRSKPASLEPLDEALDQRDGPRKGTAGLARSTVNGHRRVPKPAASRIACTRLVLHFGLEEDLVAKDLLLTLGVGQRFFARGDLIADEIHRALRLRDGADQLGRTGLEELQPTLSTAQLSTELAQVASSVEPTSCCSRRADAAVPRKLIGSDMKGT